MSESITKGVIFIATGSYAKAAIAAAASIRKHSPTLGIQLFTDHEDIPTGVFDIISPIPNPHMRSKVDFMALTSFTQTLYLDTDVQIVEDITEVFSLLKRFDIAVAHAHNRNLSSTNELWRCQIPESFPQMNSGVMLYQNTPPVLKVLADWSKFYPEAGFKKDQVTLRELLWLSDLRIATLPPEYNIRSAKYLKTWTRGEARPRILHYQRFHTELGLTTKISENRWLRRLRRLQALIGIKKTTP